MVEYNTISAKLSDWQYFQLSKLKTVAKNNGGTTLRISNKNFNEQYFLHELFLTQKQATKLL